MCIETKAPILTLVLDRIEAKFDLTFIRQRGNVIFPGPPGVGKTRFRSALKNGLRVRPGMTGKGKFGIFYGGLNV